MPECRRKADYNGTKAVWYNVKKPTIRRGKEAIRALQAHKNASDAQDGGCGGSHP
jgi:hypothetical protein